VRSQPQEDHSYTPPAEEPPKKEKEKDAQSTKTKEKEKVHSPLHLRSKASLVWMGLKTKMRIHRAEAKWNKTL